MMHDPASPSPRSVVFAVLFALFGCATRRPAAPSPMHVPSAPATASAATTTAPAAPADPLVEAYLDAMVSQGAALVDHVGPEAAAAIHEDLARRPARYLDRFEARYLSQPVGEDGASLFLADPLWLLLHVDEARTRRLAARAVRRYSELAARGGRVDDPGFAARVADRTRAMQRVRDGVDVTAGPRWQVVPPSATRACVDAAPDGTPLLVVARDCTCGEPLACRAEVRDGALRVDVRFDPESPSVCTDCYPTSTGCTVPTLPSGAALRVIVNGAEVATWHTDARGTPTDARCAVE